MTDQLTSPSNSSIDPNILRLNSSSCCMVSPSQSNFGSHLKDNLIQFEQYTCSSQAVDQNVKKISALGQGIGKKKLTIQIDQSYDDGANLQQSYACHQKIENGQKNKAKPHHGLQLESYSFESESRQIGDLQLISPIDNKNLLKILELQDKLRDYEQRQEKNTQLILEKNEKIQMLEEKTKQHQAQLKKRDEEFEYKDQKITFLEERLAQREMQLDHLKDKITEKESQISQSLLDEIEDRMKDKDSKIKQLAKINEKLKNLNKDLIREVKASEKKVRDLEKEIQNNLCLLTQENIHRMKQSSLKMKQKENHQRYNNTQHTKTQRDSIPTYQGKQKQSSFAGTGTNLARRSLERKKNPSNNTTSTGQLVAAKKPSTMKISSSSNTILHKKLMQK